MSKSSFLGRLWASLFRVVKKVFTKEFIIKTLKDKFVKVMLKKIFGRALLVGGFKVWLVKFLLESGFTQIILPLTDALGVEVKYVYRRIDGKIISKRLDKAIEENNEEDYEHAIGDLYGD